MPKTVSENQRFLVAAAYPANTRLKTLTIFTGRRTFALTAAGQHSANSARAIWSQTLLRMYFKSRSLDLTTA